MPILIHRTYSEVTPESAEDGDMSDTGSIVENAEYGFRELVRAMKDHRDASCSPASGSVHEWYSTGFHTSCYASATEREECIHYSEDNPPRHARYWRLAAIAAGLVKGAPQ